LGGAFKNGYDKIADFFEMVSEDMKNFQTDLSIRQRWYGNSILKYLFLNFNRKFVKLKNAGGFQNLQRLMENEYGNNYAVTYQKYGLSALFAGCGKHPDATRADC